MPLTVIFSDKSQRWITQNGEFFDCKIRAGGCFYIDKTGIKRRTEDMSITHQGSLFNRYFVLIIGILSRQWSSFGVSWLGILFSSHMLFALSTATSLYGLPAI